MPQTMPTQPFGVNQVPVSRIALGCMGLAGTWNPAEVGPENTRAAPSPPSRPRWTPASRSMTTPTSTAARPASWSSRTASPPSPAAARRSSSPPKSASGPGYYDHSPDYIRESLRGSLDRMGVEYVDLYQLHRPDPLEPPRRDRRSAGRAGRARGW